MGRETRKLGELISSGPAMLGDFKQLGIPSVAQLAREYPPSLPERLNHIPRQRDEICVLDAFSTPAVQARSPRLGAEKCPGWYGSRKRKVRDARR